MRGRVDGTKAYYVYLVINFTTSMSTSCTTCCKHTIYLLTNKNRNLKKNVNFSFLKNSFPFSHLRHECVLYFTPWD